MDSGPVQTTTVRWLEDVSAGDLETVGGKGASLGELTDAGLPVPPGFLITAGTYRRFIEAAGIDDELFAAMEIDPEDSAALKAASETAHELIMETPLPEAVREEILAAYHDVGDGEAFVAVRSSATAEDLPDASFAGQQETFLNVREEELLERVKECWASLFSQRAIYYRERQGFPHDAADIVSVAVPTPFHYETVLACIDRGVDVLVEKPFVDDLERGHTLATRAREAGVTLQVGHIERFNPATRVLADIVPDLDVVAVDIDRLGPPVDREGEDSVVMDLMIHDIDILLSLIDAEIESLSATAHDERHANAQFTFDDGSIASLTASRLTQQKVRQLSVTAKSCRVNVDFISQTVEIHRHSVPEYVESDGDVRYRHESVVERPIVENGEPLKAELEGFVAAVRDGTEPVVTAEDALRVLEIVQEIETAAFGQKRVVVQ